MKPDDRDIICQQDYAPLSNAELLTQIEQHTAIMYTSPIIDFDLEWIIGPARALLARVEATEAEARRVKEAGRMVKEEVVAWRDSYESLNEQRLALAARVAELESQLAAQQWRPGSETPAPDWYQTAETIDGVFSHAYFDGAVWQGYPDNYPPMWYRPIPPLPQEPTP